MSRYRSHDLLDRTFVVALVLKGLDGVLELAGGLALLLVSRQSIVGWVATLTQHELSEDPHDFIATHLLVSAHHLTAGAQTFAAVYLLLHGIVKVVLVAAVLRDQLWAYPWMIAFLLVFIGYQGYRFAIRPTFGMAALTVFDALVAWLTWREWRRRRSQPAH
ncbi:MAG: DUF2127 domain-containing protein [Nocardioidaceae bacterium]